MDLEKRVQIRVQIREKAVEIDIVIAVVDSCIVVAMVFDNMDTYIHQPVKYITH